MDTKGREWERLGCSRGRSPRIVLKPGRPIAFPNGSAALTADVADGADEIGAISLPELSGLLVQGPLSAPLGAEFQISIFSPGFSGNTVWPDSLALRAKAAPSCAIRGHVL